MNDDIRSLDDLVEHTVLCDPLLEHDHLDATLVLAAVFAQPSVRL